MGREIQFGILLIGSLILARPVRSQEILIRVLNAHNGKPITDECVNVFLGLRRNADLLAPTNKDGVVVLHLARNEVAANSVSPSPCARTAILGPKPGPNGDETIAITSDYYFDCQEWTKAIPADSPTGNSNTTPTYRIQKILDAGVAAGNRCGRFRAEAKPGELIFFVRPLTLLENMQR